MFDYDWGLPNVHINKNFVLNVFLLCESTVCSTQY